MFNIQYLKRVSLVGLCSIVIWGGAHRQTMGAGGETAGLKARVITPPKQSGRTEQRQGQLQDVNLQELKCPYKIKFTPREGSFWMTIAAGPMIVKKTATTSIPSFIYNQKCTKETISDIVYETTYEIRNGTTTSSFIPTARVVVRIPYQNLPAVDFLNPLIRADVKANFTFFFHDAPPLGDHVSNASGVVNFILSPEEKFIRIHDEVQFADGYGQSPTTILSSRAFDGVVINSPGAVASPK